MAVDQTDLLKILSTIFELRAQKTLQSAEKIADREAAITRKLSDTRDHKRRTQITTLQSNAFRQVGGDILWQTWLHATTRQLNMDLAKARAQKAPLLARAQRNMARSEAAQIALKDTLKRQAKALQRQRSATIQEMGVLKDLSNKR